jgi:hypothetical protein
MLGEELDGFVSSQVVVVDAGSDFNNTGEAIIGRTRRGVMSLTMTCSTRIMALSSESSWRPAPPSSPA